MGKKKRGKLPKEVLGVKVPKDLRKAGDKLIEQAQGPAGRQAIAGALTAVVGAVASAALAREAAKAAAPERAPHPAAEKPQAPAETFARIADALIDGIRTRRG